MHVADRRHGLDVAAVLRRGGVRDRDVLAAAVLHDCAKGDTGPLPRIAWSLGEAYGPWVWAVARRVPGWDAALTRLETHAEASAQLVESAGLPPFAVDLVRYQAEPRDPTYGDRVPRRGRGLLMVDAGLRARRRRRSRSGRVDGPRPRRM